MLEDYDDRIHHAQEAIRYAGAVLLGALCFLTLIAALTVMSVFLE